MLWSTSRGFAGDTGVPEIGLYESGAVHLRPPQLAASFIYQSVVACWARNGPAVPADDVCSSG